MVFKSTEGEYAGCYMHREFAKDKDEIVVKPLPQVGFLLGPDGKYEYFLLDAIPTQTELDKMGLQKQPRAIIGLALDAEEMVQVLKEKGIPFNLGGPLAPGEIRDSILCQVEGTIDHVIFRSIAKIAFNYLARWEGADFVQHPAFDRARRYIRWQHAPGYKLIQVDELAVLADEPVEGTRRLGHLVTVNWAEDGVSVLAQVSLMNWMTYRVALAPDFTGPPPELTRGHFFNVGGLDIHELGTRPRVQEPN